MLFDELAAECLDSEIRPTVDYLLKLKRETPELGEGKRIDILNDYLDYNIESLNTLIADLPQETQNGWEELNSLFLSVLGYKNLNTGETK